MSSWSFLHIGAELIRGRTIDVPASERELAANHVLPTLWLALFDPEELEIFDVTDDEGVADLLDSGLIAEGDRDLDVFWVTRRELAAARAEYLWEAARSDPYFGLMWRPLELLAEALRAPTLHSTVLLDPREFVGAVGLSDFLEPAREVVGLFAAVRERGLDAVRAALLAHVHDNPVIFAMEFTGDAARDTRLAQELIPLTRLETAGHVLVSCTVGWPTYDEALLPRWEAWIEDTQLLVSPTAEADAAAGPTPGEEAGAFLAFLEENGLIEYRHRPRDLLVSVGQLLTAEPVTTAAGPLYEVLMSDDAVDEVFCDVETLQKALDVWG
ncbi:MAG: hypothetical protein CVU56_15925 [Deltaproteobacteria bacterium HGW-Deltaproteobacteria-14]|jgi:hypothetical protein|nr:MAG: hypothetical protein CVU56_15925 [Deltaproteobacteria bacterium HGW-Deltaproteobacteria-14]